MNFGEYVRMKRLEKGILAKSLSRVLQVSPSFLSAIEMKNKIPSGQIIVKIADMLRIDRMELLDMARHNRVEAYKRLIDKKWSKYFLHPQ